MFKRILGGLVLAGLLAAGAGCGGGDKSEVPTSFTPKPDKPPSAAGVGPVTPKPGGGGTKGPGGGGATSD